MSARDVHDKLSQVLDLMSLPEDMAKRIRENSKVALEQRLKMDSQSVKEKEKQLSEVESKLFAIEEKWISNQINRETYERWFEKLNIERSALKNEMQKLNISQSSVYVLLEKNLDKITNIRQLYESAEVSEKQEMLRLIFADTLYFKDGLLHSKVLLPFLSSNLSAMEEKGLLLYEGEKAMHMSHEALNEMVPFLSFIEQFKKNDFGSPQMNISESSDKKGKWIGNRL